MHNLDALHARQARRNGELELLGKGFADLSRIGRKINLPKNVAFECTDMDIAEE